MLLKKPLNMGVHVIAAHVASEGMDIDYDDPKLKKKPSIDLLMRMMRMKEYKDLLYADISAITAFRRVCNVEKILRATDLHKRFIYGSDFPVPAVNIVVWLWWLEDYYKLIPPGSKSVLKEIWNYNPALSDFVRKRIMRYIDED
eukprot:UN32031